MKGRGYMVAGTRPRNRKALIRVAAAELFRERGYHNVSVADVAEAVGMTAPALYRHYRNKRELLAAAVHSVIDSIEEVLNRVDGFDDLLRQMAALSVQQHGLAGIWLRESRNLDDEQRATVAERSRTLMKTFRSYLRDERPELPESDCVLLSVAVIGVFAMPAKSRHLASRTRPELLLYAAARASAKCQIGTSGSVVLVPEGNDADTHALAGVRMPRREVLLNAAIRLFDERGFQAVGLGDIADAAGIVRSGVYRYFDNKTEILIAAMTTAADRMWRSATAALALSDEPHDALGRIVRGHVEFALENPHLLGIMVYDRAELPEHEQRRFDRLVDDYDEVWPQALLQARPDSDIADGIRKIHLARVMIFYSVRWGPQPRRADLGERLTEIAMSILTA